MSDLFTPIRNKIDRFLQGCYMAGIRPRTLKLSIVELTRLKGETGYDLVGYYPGNDRSRPYCVKYRRVPLRLVSKDVWIR